MLRPPLVEQDPQPLPRVDAEMEVALGTAVDILIERLLPNNLFALLALQPEAFSTNMLCAIVRCIGAGLLSGKPRNLSLG